MLTQLKNDAIIFTITEKENVMQENKELLLEFLNMPIQNGTAILDKFKAIPNATYGEGSLPQQRYVYIPGTRRDRVVLVAHVDTAWDENYIKNLSLSSNRSVLFKNGLFYSGNLECGLGADDRAGCAMLWKLKDTGHSILLVDGEEKGKHGARYIKSSNPHLFNELNNHCFMIELDHISTNHASYAQVHNTSKFKKYFSKETGFVSIGANGGCDLQILCNKICGVNVGVGYYNHHTKKEYLVLEEWEKTYTVLKAFLVKEKTKFKTSKIRRFISFVKRCINKILRIFRIKK